MTRRFALVALWLTATVIAVLLASFAVRLAGDKVVAQGPATVTRSEVEAGLSTVPGTVAPAATSAPAPAAAEATDASTVPAPTPVPSVPTTVPGSPGAVSSPTSGVGDPPTTTVDTGSSGGPGGAGGSGSDDPAPPPTTSAPAVTTPPSTPVEQSFPLVGGSVRLRCAGDLASLVSSSPNPGYSMDVRSTGPREVEVRFVGASHTSELKGSCTAGQITAEPKESGGGGGGGNDGPQG